jgi:hypothetical protein
VFQGNTCLIGLMVGLVAKKLNIQLIKDFCRIQWD